MASRRSEYLFFKGDPERAAQTGKVTEIPLEILLQIAKDLGTKDLMRLSATCCDLRNRLGPSNQFLYWHVMKSAGRMSMKPKFGPRTNYFGLAASLHAGNVTGYCVECLLSKKSKLYNVIISKIHYKILCTDCLPVYTIDASERFPEVTFNSNIKGSILRFSGPPWGRKLVFSVRGLREAVEDHFGQPFDIANDPQSRLEAQLHRKVQEVDSLVPRIAGLVTNLANIYTTMFVRHHTFLSPEEFRSELEREVNCDMRHEFRGRESIGNFIIKQCTRFTALSDLDLATNVMDDILGSDPLKLPSPERNQDCAVRWIREVVFAYVRRSKLLIRTRDMGSVTACVLCEQRTGTSIGYTKGQFHRHMFEEHYDQFTEKWVWRDATFTEIQGIVRNRYQW
ncbi:hypothetical protein ABW19_dt0204288 [Dactylella cylindrospora]|nr:hypothetical protein ABW19_dt0204288 [Dactylella cylindrospora]